MAVYIHPDGCILFETGIHGQFKCYLIAIRQGGNATGFVRMEAGFIAGSQRGTQVSQFFSGVVAYDGIGICHFTHLMEDVKAGVAAKNIQQEARGRSKCGG